MFRNRRLVSFVAVLCVGGMLFGVFRGLGAPSLVIWGGVFLAACLASLLVPSAGSVKDDARSRLGAPRRGRFLCDSCKYDDARYCGRPERPNATSCDEYRAR